MYPYHTLVGTIILAAVASTKPSQHLKHTPACATEEARGTPEST